METGEQSQLLTVMFWLGTASFFGLALLAHFKRWVRYVLSAVPVVMLVLFAILGQWCGLRGFVNWLVQPERLLPLVGMMFVLALIHYRRWTHPWFAGLLLAAAGVGCLLSLLDPHFFKIVSKPDNIPIALMIFAVGFFLWVGLRRMAINDGRIERGEPLAEGDRHDRVMVWPDLVLVELLIMLIATMVLIVWAVLVRAPLEAPANPAVAPNPAKAPWYFLGLQELLVYFDPWIAGVLLPVLIIFALCALPYLDRNPQGNGYYTFKGRPFAVSIFLFGFVILWVLPIIIGTFLRGPNWLAFGPFEPWDANRSVSLADVNLSDIFWTGWLGWDLPTRESTGSNYYYLVREAPGLIALVGYFTLVPLLLAKTVLSKMRLQMGRSRYAIMMVLLAAMFLIPIKMLLRWWFNLKYLVAIWEGPFNI